MASDELEIVVINRLGFHKSHLSPVLNFNDQVRVVEPFLNEKRNIILGISYGGALALTAALNYPDKIEGVITGAALITEPHNYAKAIVGSEAFTKLENVTPKKVQHMKAEIIGRRKQIGPLLKRLAELRVPVEVLHGTLDTLVPKSDAQILMKAIGDRARYHEIKGGTHYMELQMPKRILKALDDLILRIDPEEA
jgi:pimeloyl-ACP methyl ester carboxylesterase